MTKNVSTQDIPTIIEQLIAYARDNLSLKSDDVIYVRNQLLYMFNNIEPGIETDEYGDLQDDIINPLIEFAIKSRIIKKIDTLLFETRLMGIVTPCPSQIIENFDSLASSKGVEDATNYFYDISVKSNYIRKCDIDKNIEWSFNGTKGEIKLTINLSKPEKDPKEVLAASKIPQSNYPKCKLCPTNIGYSGNYNYPPRQTLRTIPIYLNEENWHFQFSPYSYFHQHLIALSDEHRPMVVDSDALVRMLDFVDIFPHYFIGSNAALPIVGGSILSHDHYQGGSKIMPMMKAKVLNNYFHHHFHNVKLSIIQWYNSVIRLSSTDRYELVKAASYVMDYWNTYTDKDVNIIAKTTKQHNAVTPIVRLEENVYVIDFILRNNRTDKDHPYGIFHPAEDLHNIKKESIGIIEVMGLFILPGRLFQESQMISDYLTGAKKLNFQEIALEEHPLNKHLSMIAQLSNDYGLQLTSDRANEVINEYINNACEKILKATAVFKDDKISQFAFQDLIISMGFDKD